MKLSLVRILALWIIVLLAVLFVAAGLFLLQGKELGARHVPFAYEDFDYANGNFAAYIDYSTARMQAARLDSPSQTLIDNLAPFALEPDATCPLAANRKVDKGIVLIHGLIDSPYSMRPFGEALRMQCFYVLGLLLPGHGTRPGDMLDSSWEEWLEATHFATEQLAAMANTLFVSGHSAGGTLALLEAARNPEVDGLMLFAPALALSPAAKYARYVALLGVIFPKAAWFEVRPDEALYRYESFTLASAAETYALIQATQAALANMEREVPVFTVASMQDNTVNTPAILDYMVGNTHEASFTLLYTQYPVPVGARTQAVMSGTPGQGILSVSHLGLMTPPSHPYFGRDGAYRNCGHYVGDEASLYTRCKAGERDFYGEATPDNLARGVVERIAFNPWYERLLQDLEGFFRKVVPVAAPEAG